MTRRTPATQAEAAWSQESGGPGFRRKPRAGRDKPLAPIAPENLEIGRLASRLKEADLPPQPVPVKAGVARVSVQLFRANIDVDDDAMHFRLKMALLRGLRRRFRYSVIDVDDAPVGAESNGAFVVDVDPAQTATLQRASSIVARVLRWRRWRALPDEDEHSDL